MLVKFYYKRIAVFIQVLHLYTIFTVVFCTAFERKMLYFTLLHLSDRHIYYCSHSRDFNITYKNVNIALHKILDINHTTVNIISST